MREIHVCEPISRIVRDVADKTTGAPPDAITLGEFVFLFGKIEGEELARLRRHEQVHITQQARMAPAWAAWMPKRVRVYLGAPRFYATYYAQYKRHGYWDAPLEVEARAAE